MSKQFEPPSWSTPPTEEFYFEVLKDGSIVSTLPLSEKPHYTIGRNGDMCDIVLEHQTVSRMHAATMVSGPVLFNSHAIPDIISIVCSFEGRMN